MREEMGVTGPTSDAASATRHDTSPAGSGPAAGQPTVSGEGLRATFGRTKALDGVSLALSTGVSGLLGPNGAGKTTLLRLLATVAAPGRGSLRLLGEDPRDL